MTTRRSTLHAIVALVAMATHAGMAQNTDTASPGISEQIGLDPKWKQTVEIPAVRDPNGGVELAGGVLQLWVEQGWLLVRRARPSGEVEWQVVLARAGEVRPPRVDVGANDGSLALSYGAFFIRENFGAVRILRERKTSASPPFPSLVADPKRTALGEAGSGVRLRGWTSKEWCWVESGLPERADLLLRLTHVDLRGKGNGFGGRQTLAGMYFGDARVQDEGDLFIAERAIPDLVELGKRRKHLQEHFGEEGAPALETGERFNTPGELRLEDLRGKVVLLDFWGQWCGPCVKNLPHVKELAEKYKEQGLTVIGIHSAQGSEKLGAFLVKHGIAFAVGVDKGETARRYVVDAWPTYFLVDKSGKLAWGYSHEPPSDEQIQSLLR